MYKTYTLAGLLALLLFSSFTTNLECQHAGSNIDFAKLQTQKALDVNDINKSRYYGYKALNAIEKSKKQLSSCSCEYADKGIVEAISDLKNAIKAESVGASQILFERSLQHLIGALESLSEHHTHQSIYAGDVLAMNTVDAEYRNTLLKSTGPLTIMEKIDISLEKYEDSLTKMVNTVGCEEAKAFAQGVYDHCQAQLLRENLSDGKKYYNIRTKEITQEALRQLGDCDKKTF